MSLLRRVCRLLSTVILVPGFGVTGPAAAQAPSATQNAPSGQPVTVSGRVVNALSGTPIPRALVNLNGRAVLTDGLGRFEFPQFTGASSGIPAASGYVQVSKPGYTASLEAADAGQPQLADLSTTLELRLYPDALITGMVTGSDRQPLARAHMMLYREMGDESGRRLLPVGFADTDSHGEYRFSQPPGRYALSLRYVPRSPETGEAVLPQRFPEQSASDTPSSFVIGPGEERKIDLQARGGPAYPVTFQADTTGGPPVNVRMFVQPSLGTLFTVFAQATRNSGEFRIELPSGTYQLRGVEQSRDQHLEAESRVTVADRPVTGLALHFSEVATLPLQVIADTAAVISTTTGAANLDDAGPTLPSAQSLNLHLQRVGAPEEDTGEIRATTLPDKSSVFRAGAGRYRLAAQGGGSWYVEKASCGNTDLLRQTLTLASGGAGETIRVVVGNATGQVTGTIRKSGTGRAGWVYLMPHEPSLIPVYTARAGADGSYTRNVPPGSYSVFAFDRRFAGNLADPATLARLQGGGTAQVAAGGKAAVDLELQAVESVQ